MNKMLIFLMNGAIPDDVLESIDRAILSAKNRKDTSLMFWVIGSMDNSLEVDCFDTETGKRANGAEALALFFNLRKKELEGQVKPE